MSCNYQSVSQNSGKRGVKYKVDDFFNVTAHQFRHTFAWFIIANRLGDLDDIKYQFKHLKRAMTLVYSERGYESLSELRTIIEYFEKLVNKQAIEDIVESAKKEQVAGGGGGVFQVSCRLKLNFMPPAFLLFSQGLNLLHLSLTSLVTSLTNGLGYSI
jgi:hypothetical protein